MSTKPGGLAGSYAQPGWPGAKPALGGAWLAEKRQRAAPLRRRAPPPRYAWVFLSAGAILVLGGAAYGLYAGFAGPPEAAATVAEAAPVTPEQAAADRAQRDQAQCAERTQVLGRRSLPPPASGEVYHRAERERMLQALEVDGKRPKFFPVSELKLSPDGKPLRVYCLLSAPLDPYTEDSWRQNGLFDCADEMARPYIRLVLVANDKALRCLSDYHVDGVAYDLAPVARY